MLGSLTSTTEVAKNFTYIIFSASKIKKPESEKTLGLLRQLLCHVPVMDPIAGTLRLLLFEVYSVYTNCYRVTDWSFLWEKLIAVTPRSSHFECENLLQLLWSEWGSFRRLNIKFSWNQCSMLLCRPQFPTTYASTVFCPTSDVWTAG